MSVYLITGDDPVLVSQAVEKLTDELLGDEDRALALTRLDETNFDTEEALTAAPLIAAAQTPPFLSDKRVIVGRHLARLSRAELYNPLVDLCGDLLDTNDVVFVWERGQDTAAKMPALPKALSEAVTKAGGQVISTDRPMRKQEATKWLKDQIVQSGLKFDAAATNALANLAGTDGGIVVGCLRTLEGALGPGAQVTAEDVTTYGGTPGSVVPWELDDAIDAGDIAQAIAVLQRQLPDRHPFQIMASLHGRYERMLRLDGSGATSDAQAAQVLNMKGSTFPAKKLLNQSRKLGTKGVGKAMKLLAEADLSLRGDQVAWPEELVMEVLVARLAALSRK